ncbi:MAG TPA: biotin--[acetyl-CoA-carboxylase] ligase [Kofleriaceae bacterium]|nr:biotin--[acetyl-CoA-carboxylase] ligase [Kofleriaceae bacterium]
MSRWLGAELHELDVCDSTNDEAAALAAAGAPHGAVVVAAAQRRGRGRLGRPWYSPAGENLYLSLVLRPELAPAALPPITLAAGVAVAEAVAGFGVRPAVKWPNDIVVAGRKLAGVLTEMSTRGERLDFLVLGIGVNLGSRSFPPELAAVATSLALEGGAATPAQLRARLLPALEVWLDRFFAGGVAAVGPAWSEWSGMAGARVRVSAGGRTVEGTACGIAADGSLDVRDDRGHHVSVVAGDVVLLPAPAEGER